MVDASSGPTMQESVGKAGGNDIVIVIALGLTRCCTRLMCRCMWSMHHCTQSMRCCMWSTRHSRQHMVPVTKPLLWTSQTALDAPIHFLLRRPNRRQDRCSLRRSFPENLITCIIVCIPHVTHHVQSSRDSRLSHFHEVSELLSQPPPVSIRKTYSHTHNSRAAQ